MYSALVWRSCMHALEVFVCPTATPVITRLASSTSGFIADCCYQEVDQEVAALLH
jgi:hypothetical protein